MMELPKTRLDAFRWYYHLEMEAKSGMLRARQEPDKEPMPTEHSPTHAGLSVQQRDAKIMRPTIGKR